jgi:hypothetical protein
VKAALWQKPEFLGRWELVIITPLVENRGERATYAQLDQLLAKAAVPPAIDLLNVSVLTPESWFSKSLHTLLRGARDMPLAKQWIGDRALDEGYVYFVK